MTLHRIRKVRLKAIIRHAGRIHGISSSDIIDGVDDIVVKAFQAFHVSCAPSAVLRTRQTSIG